ncbi:MAG: bifunctional oligoribonuclease/PAP phosphatase NrnA [Bacteroidetes bacterium QS_9_68_14]|nr:MAG: bifunctional oligoribonuclease/PAP phosphatase NrnA [Bacteroidetes bacterium QS_9_68_14]
MTSASAADAHALLDAHDPILLTTHTSPDGDAIGSELGLARYLRQRGKRVTILNDDDLPDHLAFLPGAEEVEVFAEASVEQKKALAEAELAVALDTNAAERLGALAEPIQQGGAEVLLIDHHTEPEGWFDHAFQRDTAAATAELLCEVIEAGAPELIDADVATPLYTGLMTDTGSFRYSSVTPRVHRTTATLLQRGGISPAPIHSALYDNRSLASLRLLGRALDRIRLRYDGFVGYTTVTPAVLEAAGAGPEDKHGLVGHVLSVAGVGAALLFTETQGGTKVSFRSEGDTHVDGWARSFGGGGHRNASGAYLEEFSLAEALDDVLAAAPQHIGVEPEEARGALTGEDAADLAAAMKAQGAG